MQHTAEETALIGIFTTDADLVVQVWDDAVRRMTGISPELAVGKHITDLIPDLQTRGLMTRVERVRDMGTVEVLAAGFHRFLIRCEPIRPSLFFNEMQQFVTISPLRSDSGISGVMVMIEDVTERLENERTLSARLADEDDNVRLDAARQISSERTPLSPEGANMVIGALGDRNWRVRRKLAEGLSRRLSPETVGSLLEAFRDGHLDFGLLNSALKVLQTVSAGIGPALAGFLKSDDSDLRIQAALALGELNDPSVIPDLMALLDDPDANVRYHAIEALGKLRADDAVEPLMSFVESRDFFLAFPALESLAKIGGSGTADRILPLLDDPVLSEAACDALGAVAGIEAVEPVIDRVNEGKISSNAAAEALCGILDRHSTDPAAAAAIAETAARSFDTKGSSVVSAALASATGPAAAKLVRLAGWIRRPEITAQLAGLIADENVHNEAVAALYAHGDPAVPYLIEKLEAEDGTIREAAAAALGGFDSPAAVDALIEALEADETTAALAARSLGNSTHPAAFEALVEHLSSDSAALRRHATQALRSVAREDTAPRLCQMLAEEANPPVRESLVRIIGGINTPQCCAAIVAACDDEEPLVRAAAVEQLPGLHGDAGTELFEKAFNDGDARVRSAAARALETVAGPDAQRLLRAALSDNDPWTRYFAVRSLAVRDEPGNIELLKTVSEQDNAEQVRAAAAAAISGR